jgi:uncharacterized hydrophobic protein (TIGR00271 family)
MLHLRVIVPPGLTDTVTELLVREPGVVHLSIAPAVAVDPAGDVLEADIEHGALSALISRLQDLHVDRVGSYAFWEVMDARSASADAAHAASARVGDDLSSWHEVAAHTRDDTVVTDAYLLLMAIAGIIASGGILTNNELLIVGAMIISPDYGPLAGLCVAIVGGIRERANARSSAWALLLGFSVAAAAAAVVGVLAAISGQVPVTYLAGVRPVTELIAEPNLGSLVVALAAGVAGIIALGQAKSGAIVGVLVSVTTIPAVANVGVALALGNVDEAIGALGQLLINVAGLLTAGVVSLWIGTRLSRRRAIRELRGRRSARRHDRSLG